MKILFWTLLCLISLEAPVYAEPISLHPDNPHYFLFQKKPTLLITSGEHYGAIVNPDFDYHTYLETLAKDGLNLTRIFVGTYFEPPNFSGIQKNTLSPKEGHVLTPWSRSDEPGCAGGGNKFDLEQWDETYFHRLKDFVHTASQHGIVVEITLFSSIYGKPQWNILAFHPDNNVNNTDFDNWKAVHTLQNGTLLNHQKRLVRRVVEVLNDSENIYFEIQNEPWADNGRIAAPVNPYLPDWRENWRNRVDFPTKASFEWQLAIAQIIHRTESTLPNHHLIAQNFANFQYSLVDVDPLISILNFHYAFPDAVHLNFGWDRVIGFDESGFAGSEDETYRRQAWNFILAGGGLFNNLDYSFTAGQPDGTDSNVAPGGGSPALRKQLGFLKRFIEELDFVHMLPASHVVVRSPGAKFQVLAEAGSSYAIYLDGPLRGDLVLNLPEGTYNITWMNVVLGEEKQEHLVHAGGRIRLLPPSHKVDIALKIRAL